MKNPLAKWSLERQHPITKELFYLSPGTVNWISRDTHEKYGTRYGRWLRQEAESLMAYFQGKADSTTWKYSIVPYESIK